MEIHPGECLCNIVDDDQFCSGIPSVQYSRGYHQSLNDIEYCRRIPSIVAVDAKYCAGKQQALWW